MRDLIAVEGDVIIHDGVLKTVSSLVSIDPDLMITSIDTDSMIMVLWFESDNNLKRDLVRRSDVSVVNFSDYVYNIYSKHGWSPKHSLTRNSKKFFLPKQVRTSRHFDLSLIALQEVEGLPYCVEFGFPEEDTDTWWSSEYDRGDIGTADVNHLLNDCGRFALTYAERERISIALFEKMTDAVEFKLRYG